MVLNQQRRNIQKINLIGLNQTIDTMVKASGVRWLGYVLRKEDGDVLKNVIEFNVDGRRDNDRKECGESK